MFSLNDGIRYLPYNQPTDMRKSYHYLSGIVTNILDRDLCNGDVYIFINKNRNRIKLVEEPTAAAIDIRADYVAKNGAPSAAAPKIFFRYYYVNSSTGEKSGVMLAETTWTAAAAGGEP